METTLTVSKSSKLSTEASSELVAFKKAAAKAVQEHAELKKSYDKLRRKFQESEKIRRGLEKKLVSTEQELSNLGVVSEAACEEFTHLHIKYEVEQKCRLTAEKYATKMVKENKDIKRKSAAFLSRAGEDLVRQFELSLEEGDEEETENGADTGQVKELNARIEDLRDQLVASKRDLEQVLLERDEAREEVIGISHQGKQLAEQLLLERQTHDATKATLEAERVAHESVKMALEEKVQTIAQFRRVSTVVFQELFEVKGKYEEEAMLREKAENFAAQMYKERQAADAHKRQSMLMLNEAIGPDEKMEEVMKEVEILTKELADEKQKHEKEIAQMQASLREAGDVELLNSLETKLSIAREENEALEKKVNDQLPNMRKLQDKIAEQDTTIKKLMAELDKAMLKPVAPPPPPPPPPPPVPHSPLEVLRKIIGVRRANKGGGGGAGGAAGGPAPTETDGSGNKAGNDPHQKQYEATIEEMMNRIKSGRVKLKPVQTEEKTLLNRKGPGSIRNMSPAMSQLNGMLTVLKKRGPQSDVTSGSDSATQDAPSQELAAIMQRRRKKTEEITLDKPAHEEVQEDSLPGVNTNNLQERRNGTTPKSKRKPPVPVPRSSPTTKLTKSTSVDSGMTESEKPSKKDKTDSASIKTCPEMSLAEEGAYSEVMADGDDKKSNMSFSESFPSFKGSSDASSEFSEKNSDISSNKGSGELDDILLHANPAYESAESIPFSEEGAGQGDGWGDYETLRIGAANSTHNGYSANSTAQ
ncbi:shootin-1-like isoform X2 [Acanthaster planci]|uniref:Shootin-1-like isoform X2 n=1 Tax=Acanthaster planci TaxID=133434 RepID=A0A8B7YM43_ACAPL|nr:shootin-1-like isoform X2 [Acanthaster planci]